MSEERYYPGWGHRAQELAEWLRGSYSSDDFETQLLTIQGDGATTGGMIIQIRERYVESWQKTLSTVAGLDTSATVTLRREGEGLSAEIGGGKWLDKAAVAGVGLLTIGLLLLPAGIGAVKQSRLLSDIVGNLDRYVRTSSSGGDPAASAGG